VLLLTRLFFLKKEIKSVTRQINSVNQHKTHKKVDLSFYDKEIEQLAVQVNLQMDQTNLAMAEKRRTENELKQAITNISHDIRTPMTSILGYIQLLESNSITTEERMAYTAIVKNGAIRLKVLLNDFFELSIIETSDYPLKMDTIKLNSLVLEVIVGFYEEFNQRQMEPVVHLPEEDILLKADSSAVKRVIENLVLNAIRHSSGNVDIRLDRKQTSIELVISNEADRLNEKDLAHMFDRFYKADKTRSEKSTGLGLSIAKSLMVKMDGKLSAELIEKRLYMKCEWTYR
jgi:signal transduction histidine kinase